MSTPKWPICRRISRWGERGPTAAAAARSGADRVTCMAYCVHPGPAYAWSLLPPVDVEGLVTGTSKGLAHALRRCAPAPASSLALGVAACGEYAGSGGDADPASLVPAGAPVYVEAAVPEGEQREEALAAAGKIMRTRRPGRRRCSELVERGLPRTRTLTWERTSRRGSARRPASGRRDLAGAPSRAARSSCATKDAEAAEAALAQLARTTRRKFDGALPRRRRLRRSTTRASPTASSTTSSSSATEAAFKRTVDAARRRRHARRRRPLQERGRRPRGRQPRPLLRGHAGR